MVFAKVNTMTPPSPKIADSHAQWASQELLVIREIARLLGRSLDPSHTIREMLRLLSEFLGLNRGRVVLPDAEGGQLAIRYAYGLTEAEMRRGRYAVGEGITGRVYASGQTLIVQDIDAEPGFLCRAVERSRLPQETVAFLALPIEMDNQVAGVLGVHRLRHRNRQFAQDVQILRIVATLIAQILKINALVAQRTARLESENRALKFALERSAALHGIVGESPLIVNALRQIEQVADTDATVLLLGESGTGKELFARALHLFSARRDAPFIKVNCGAIPETLFESELFGHEKGAFTGATAGRPGRFEQADGGTLFLDEIGDLPLPMQVKLLRVLQERTVQRIGGRHEIPVNVRIVAATSHDLQQRVAQGQFRLDLYYRLNVIPVRLPSLRERPEDVRSLTRYFLNHINQTYQRSVNITPDALDRLAAYSWPGNVRQLRNVLERMALLAANQTITAADVQAVLATESVPSSAAIASGFPVSATVQPGGVVRPYRLVREEERAAIMDALTQTRGNKSRAAQRLGLTLRQLNYRIKLLGISLPR
ncbi:MAG: sigma-54-dependent Fis family transcriptional regulator [Azospira oryzae]|nr:MAG: sigma-54-dependent Fis family transcriptional regulator [Azospira oryzae]PZP82700.1 MAG: sigma-54-dependent Fis family transcriptional regulator [Azospira oryzae]